MIGCPKVELYAKTSEWTDLQEKAKKEEMEFNLIGNK